MFTQITLIFEIAHYECADMDIAFINSKGFGGNNATATVLSPKVTMQMLAKRHGDERYEQLLARKTWQL